MRKIFEPSGIHHGRGATCAALGSRTGNVLATGGRDKEICLWALTGKNPVQTMAGFVSQLECVLFSWNELEVAGGSISGAVKIWDIQKGQTVCSLAGHRGKVKCLAQSQFEDYFWASGAFDGHVKLWDVRSCQLVATYRGHSNKTVTAMEFSPDGRWVVTGGEDCVIKLWDITAGKVLAELSGHSAPLTAVQFHPNEYLLASSSQDKTVRFWDMETYECVSQSAPDSTGPVRCILFDPSGRCLYSASSGGSLRVVGWEPARVFDSESCPSQWSHHWRGITAVAMSVGLKTVVAACLGDETESGGSVSVFSIDATPLRPIDASLITATAQTNAESTNNNNVPSSDRMRRSFYRTSVDCGGESGDGNCGKNAEKISQNDSGAMENEEDAFVSKPKLPRSPPKTPVPSDPTTTPHPASNPNMGATFTVVDAVSPQRQNVASAAQHKKKTMVTVHPLKTGGSRKVVHEVTPRLRSSMGNGKPPTPTGKRSNPVRDARCGEVDSGNAGGLAKRTSDEESGEEIATGFSPDSKFGRTFTLAPEDFMPKAQSSAALSATFTVIHEATTLPTPNLYGQAPAPARNVHFAKQTITGEEDCLLAIEKACSSMSLVMEHRQSTLSLCKTAWKNRGPIAAVELACQMNDPSAVVDILNILNFRSNIWKLDVCVLVLPQLRQLLDSKYDIYVHTAVNSLRLVLRGFGQIIKNGLQAGNKVPSIGVDISLEERISKCQKCYGELMAIRESVQRKHKLKSNSRGGKNAHTYRELSLLLSSLDV